jgi:hypothetical protein
MRSRLLWRVLPTVSPLSVTSRTRRSAEATKDPAAARASALGPRGGGLGLSERPGRRRLPGSSQFAGEKVRELALWGHRWARLPFERVPRCAVASADRVGGKTACSLIAAMTMTSTGDSSATEA